MDVIKNFKQMPLLLKVFFIVHIFTLITSVLSLVRMEQVSFSYFESGFPQNYPLVWHIYNVLIATFGIYVYLQRSYSLLLKYVILGVVLLVIALLNFVYSLMNITEQTQIIASIVVYGIILLFAGLIMTYLLRQKKYFNKA